MKKLIIIFVSILSSISWSQTFDACASDVFYTTPGPNIVHAEQSGGNIVALNTFPALRVNGTGSLNGLGANRLDGCLYYLNNSGGTVYLIKMDANGDTTVVYNNMSYSVNGTVDACGRYIQYAAGKVLRTDIATGFKDTVIVPTLGFITDLDYNPFNCKFYFVVFNSGNIIEVDTNGVITNTIVTPEPGTNNVGGLALSDDGSEVYLSNQGNFWSYNIATSLLVTNKTITTPAAGAPIADLASFQCDDVLTDITNGNDTLYINTCVDSVDVTFANYSTGTVNLISWDFGDGNMSSDISPTNKFETNNTYQVTLMTTRFSCETCQLEVNNYDTLILVIQPDTLVTTMTSTDPICIGNSNGTGDVATVTGGTVPYTYLWPASGTATANEINLSAGTHYVTIVDDNNCTALDSVILADPAPVDVVLSTVDASCNAFLDGEATVTPVNVGATFNYNWSSSANATAIETGLGAGAHSVVVSDINGCDTTISYTIVEPSAVVVTPFADSSICINGTITLDATALGGSGTGYSYNWTGLGAGSQAVNPTVDGCYEVIATDDNGCVSAPMNQCVTIGTALNLTVNGLDICPQSSADLSSIAGGGNGNYNYDWTIAGTSVGSQSSLLTPQSATTTYCLTLTDGCETPAVTECITIDILPEPIVTPTLYGECEGTAINFHNPVLDPSGITSYSWSFGDGQTGSGATPSHIYDYEGNYSITLNLVTTENCNYQMVLTDIVTIDAVPNASFYYSPQVITIEDTEVEFTNTSDDATTYLWDFGNNGASSTIENPTNQYPEIGNRSYPVTLWAYNGTCADSITQLIHIKDILLYYIPNAFTPDSDSYNDEFKPIMTSGFDYYDYHLTIFNRWGEVVFESFNSDFGWDGTYGNGGLAEDGTYIWKMEFGETMSDKMHKDSGHITLLR